MFILRRVTSAGNQSNECLGSSYHFVDRELNEEEFQKTIDLEPFDKESVYAFIIHQKGSEVIPLHKKSRYYIMTDSGKTFANLSLR